MDIKLYDRILRDLKNYNENLTEENYGNSIVGEPPMNPTYPLTVIDEIVNLTSEKYSSIYDKVSLITYRVDIYSKQKGEIRKKVIARKIAKQIDVYMTDYVGLKQRNYSAFIEEEGNLYHIILLYTTNYYENKGEVYK